jgi:Tfp pilus assembly protein PilN
VLVHVDEQCTDFVVVTSGKPLFVRSIPVGSKHFMDDIHKYEEKFAQEIRNSLESYLSEDIDKPPVGMVLAGAVEMLSETPAALSKVLGIPVRVSAYMESFLMGNEVFNKLSVAKYASFLDAWSYFFARIPLQTSLIPEEIKLKQQVEQRGRELIKTGILLLLIFVLFFFTLITKITFSTLYLQKVDALFQPRSKEARKLEEDFAKVSLIKQYLSRRGFSLEVLTELYNTSTDELQLSDIRFDEQGKFTVRGTAETMSAVFSFVENLEKSNYFKDVKTKYTTKRKEGLRDVTDFEINAFLSRKGEKK